MACEKLKTQKGRIALFSPPLADQNSKLKMRKYVLICLVVFLFFVLSDRIYAESSYVLPYPPSMPGSRFYKARVMIEQIQGYWYFGDFGQFDYYRKLSDRYLVEAKTLFEYKQYLLAISSLQKSDDFFSKIQPNLNNAKELGKNISNLQRFYEEERFKHIETLQKIKNQTPESFNWYTSKKISTDIPIREIIDKSITLRESL